MGEYEPHDSRNVTLKDERAPGEPPRTGPRERQARNQAPLREQGRAGSGHQHQRDRLLGVVERQRQAVDVEEPDHAEQSRVAVAADRADHVPGEDPRVAPA